MNDRQTGQSFSSLPRSQKTAVVVLSIFAVGILGIWIWQSNSRLNSPFKASDAEIAQAEAAAKEKAAAAEAEKTKDTDGDGLTDSDEINIYKTSPYLEDTDGDGISDYNEVKRGTDPLCAEGSSCSLVASQKVASTTTSSVSSSANSTASSSPASNVDQDLLIKALSGQGDASTMRQILLQGGANAEEVKLLSDSDLMDMYNSVLSAQNPTVATSTATSTAASSTNQ